jgi:hypothetical protein
MGALSELYKTDFHAWTLEVAELIRQHRFAELNVEDLAEELDSMGNQERREVANRLVILLAHLLKWQFQPAYRSASWRGSIIEQRKQIIRQLRDNSSLRAHLSDAVLDAYPDAVDIAARETLLEPLTFPLDCPYGIEQILEDDYYPPGA